MRYYQSMKRPFPAVVFLITWLCVGPITAADSSSADLAIDRLKQRVNEGDKSALLEASHVPAELAIPWLAHFLQNSPEASPEYQAAREAMLQNPGTTNYLRERLAKTADGKGVDAEAFVILGRLASADAPALVAPFLFDFVVHKRSGDQLADCNGLSAARSLGMMRLADAPTDKHPGTYNFADFLGWQKWAIRKGFVPPSTQPNVPRWLMNLGGASPPPTAVELPSNPHTFTPPTSTPSKASTAPTPQSNVAQVSTSTPTVAESSSPVTERKSRAWPWVVGTVALVVMALMVKRQRK
jgi:hypothetical protein